MTEIVEHSEIWEMEVDCSSSTLGILTKFWEPGRVKTRLGASIGMPRAAAIHKLFVTHLCKQLAACGDHREICLDPPEKVSAFQQTLETLGLEAVWQVTQQNTGSLGSRMHHWFKQRLADHPDNTAILIGGDCPNLGIEEIETAIRLLRRHQVVLAPAIDGGYTLIGLRGPWRSGTKGHDVLFEQIPWSTDSVLRITRERIREAGFSLAELPTMADIDNREDLDHLRRQLMSNDQHRLLDGLNRILADGAKETTKE
ncbi:MAG: TIGR04282 family arsenosugar biosynthesis glycosyltransferase [Rubripirellula sp.]|jgi:rSAM/selenodomain-associated transferase 1|nr:glycosyltransferase [Planctomycetaceae bacterium]MDF1844760.1 TIGR04282 family arsenosugar biosynthesis glycosyltransferase [Rubripirellula sp.]